MSEQPPRCWHCGQPLENLLLPVSRREECAGCRAEIHACRMCRHYRPRPREWCTEDRAELPASPDTANFCDYYHISHQAWTGPAAATDQAARSELDALFGDAGSAATGTGSGKANDPAAALKDLFGDN